MQVTETSATGLKRELKVVIGQGELGERFQSRLDEVKDEVQLKGFRKGKVPVAHLKKLFGRSVMAEVVQKAIDETSRKAISDRNERPAHQPTIDFGESDKNEMEKVLAGQGDLSYTLPFEVLPTITVTDLTALKLEKEVAEVADAVVEKALADLLNASLRYEAEESRQAVMGDRVTADYVGRVEGAEFEGGRAEDSDFVLEEGRLIPGLVEGLVGAKAGEERLVKAKFPDGYQMADLAGKDAEFTVTVKAVAKPVRPEAYDEFAKTLGAQSLQQLKDMLKSRIGAEYAGVSYSKLKRQVLDALDSSHDFALPEALVAGEFDAIWRRFGTPPKAEGQGEGEAHTPPKVEGQGEGEAQPADNKSEDERKAKIRRLAERRVRLGLLIGDIGEKQKVEVTQDELKRALVAKARSFPGQERMVYEYFEKNPSAVAEQLRGPIFEDKVVGYIIEQASPAEKKVSVEELMKPVVGDDELEGLVVPVHDHDHDHDHDHHGHDHDHAHDHHHGHDHHHDHGHHHPDHGDKR
jgi:trigger factor